MACKYKINGLELTKDEFLNYVKKQPLEESAKILGISTTPAAPFITDTNNYVKLGLRVALKESVKQGADKIAWATGEQQNDRYSLEKQVDELKVKKQTDGAYSIYGYKDGNSVIEHNDVPENKIEAYIGKEIASKVINEGQTSFEGDDLKLGGKGMKGFYGSPTEGSLGIVGNVAKSLFKQEVGTVEIKLSDSAPSNEVYFNDWKVVGYIGKFPQWIAELDDITYEIGTSDGIKYTLWRGEEKVGVFNSVKQAQDAASGTETGITSAQHSIDITPELKSQVEEGLPLFQKEPVKLIPTGFVKGKKVYINSDVATIETPIHEFAHLYNAWLKENKVELYNRGLELVRAELDKKNSPIQSVIDYVKSTQPNLQGEALQEEILTQLTGKKGLELLQSKKKGGIINWIKEALAEIANMLGLSNYSVEQAMNMTIDEFAKAIAVDLLQGQKPIGITVEEAIKRNNGNPLNLAPNGNPSILYQSYKDLGYFDNEAERFTAQTFSNEFKTWFGDWQNDAENASKVMDENGQPKLMYHETAADWFIYDKTKIEAGKLDSVTPTGIFLKSSNKNIGLGNRQMNLFSSIKNPIYAKDRKELENFFSLNIKGYSEIKEKSSQVEKEYDKILEKEGPRLKEAFKKEIEDFKGELTSEDRIKLVEKVYKNSDTELNDLEVEFENLAIEAKALIDSFMKDSNYDGIFLTSDVGSKGRETDATIAMNPEQIKSATGNIGTFSPTNADIRFQTIPTEETTTIPDCV
jgi:hypothetical protein